MVTRVIQDLERTVGQEHVFADQLTRFALSSDAGFYDLVPTVVVRPQTNEHIKNIFNIAKETKTSVTFRAAGTSLSGQAVTDGILVDISRGWKKSSVLENGKKFECEPGLIGAQANRLLRKYSTKIGPDPASIDACMMGGILANNSSGMCCGIEHNAFKTLESLIFILPSGTKINSADANADEQFAKEEPELYATISEIKKEIQDNEIVKYKIINKYKIKNTMGYSLNAFIDYEKNIDIFSHLLIGSEGTLGFISQATLRTIPVAAFTFTAFILCSSFTEAEIVLQKCLEKKTSALEFFDYHSLRSSQEELSKCGLESTIEKTSLGYLIEFKESKQQNIENIQKWFEQEFINQKFIISFDIDTTDRLWKARKGLLPQKGFRRPKGEIVIIEDIAVPIKNIFLLIEELQKIFTKYEYKNTFIFGHAKDGNLHFVLSQSFQTEEEKLKYKNLMQEISDITLILQGSLKAEHGTGRNMAPFVEKEWGKECLEMMWKIKKAADPKNILNPGVILNTDPECHLKNIKNLPAIHEIVDDCIECGFCETKCPSRNYTLTPRQRIVLMRKLSDHQKMYKDPAYFNAVDTCVGDGLCAQACPVKINTGEMMHIFKKKQHPLALKTAQLIAENFSFTEKIIRFGLELIAILEKVGIKLTKFFPAPTPAPIINVRNNLSPEYVYFPTCITRTMGYRSTRTDTVTSHADQMFKVAQKSKVSLNLCSQPEGKCCGMPFYSKGFDEVAQKKTEELIHKLFVDSQEGKLPIILDTSTCTTFLKKLPFKLTEEGNRHYQKLVFVDSFEFFQKEKERIFAHVQQKEQTVFFHPTCGLQKTVSENHIKSFLSHLSHDVTLSNVSCCGFAGDAGLRLPDLNRKAILSNLEANSQNIGWSTGRTCEWGFTIHTSYQMKPVVDLIDKIVCK